MIVPKSRMSVIYLYQVPLRKRRFLLVLYLLILPVVALVWLAATPLAFLQFLYYEMVELYRQAKYETAEEAHGQNDG